MWNPFKLFAARPKNITPPSAETSSYNWYNRLVPRRFRTYNIDVGKQKQLRALSRVGIVRRGINVIKDGVLSLPYELIPVGKVNTKQLEMQKSIINNVLQNPNIIHDYKAFWGMILEDLIVLDSGIFNKCKGGNPMRPLFLYPVDAVTMEKLQPYDFTNPEGKAYIQQMNTLQSQEFSINEIAWLQMNNFTDNPYGLSPIEVMYRYLSYFLDAIDNAADIASIDTMKFVLAFKDAEQGKLKEAREYVESIQGTGKLPIFGGEVDAVQVGSINGDSLYIQWQQFLLTLCAKLFNLPESCFISGDVNDRNNLSEVRQQITKEAVKPYADLLEKAINQHILQTMGVTNVQFKFIYAETNEEKKLVTDRINSMVALDILTLDEARVKLGEQPLNTKYSKCTITESKALINEDHQINGFGSAKDSYGDKPETKISKD